MAPARALRLFVPMTREASAGRALLRHAVATVAYRGAKTLRGAPSSFADFRGGEGLRTPLAILAHVSDLFDWAWHLGQGRNQWHDTTPESWAHEVERFFRALERFDALLASETPLAASAERLFQGPVADALTHVGQLALLRRAAGAPIRGENYFVASIEPGRVGSQQAEPRREFG